jgi:hypothetical protein
MRNGEAAIYLKSGGDPVIDRISDISSTRLVLETERSGEIPLRDIWMINFINDRWDFPEERKQLETNEHYVFLRNGNVSAGRIVDFSSDRKVFQFEAGEEFPLGQIRRIYFSRNVPNGLSQGAGGQDVQEAGIVGVYEQVQEGKAILITLSADNSARIQIEGGRNQSAQIMNGRWEATKMSTVNILFDEGQVARGVSRNITLRRAGDTLVGAATLTPGTSATPLRLRRR